MLAILFEHLKRKFVRDDVDYSINIETEKNSVKNNCVELQAEASKKSDSLQASSNSNEKCEFFGKIATAECMDGEINDVFTIIHNDIEHFACVKDLQWNLCVDDKVKVFAERDDNNELVIVRIEPKRRKDFEFGRLTALSFEKKYAVFEENTLLLFSAIKGIQFPLKIHEEYKYETIESDQKFDAKLFDCRVLKILEKIESKVSGHGISIHSEPFKIFYNPEKNYVSRFIKILNRSERAVDLLAVEALPLSPEGSKFVELDMKDRIINYNLSARNGNFKIYFRVFPLQIGTFEYKLIVKFKDFDEIHKFKVEISNSYIINAPRIKSKPRFVDIKLEEYPVPCELKDIDYTKLHSALEELQSRYSFLNESSINAENYLEKMRYGIYLEEIAIEKAFANYRMEQTSFETKDEFLRLIVKDVAEKRPSITVGDHVTVTDPFRTDKERPVYEGIIQKVENESILCKFHDDFHSTHHEKSYTVNFNFSRSTYRKQQHALERVLSDDGLGFNFLFPNKIESKLPQVDATIDEKGNLIVNNYPRNWCNNLLNEHQKKAVVNVMRGENRPLPYIFFGCPGSGKTQTLVEAILQIYIHIKSSRIIVATPSNSAANSITEMLLQSNKFCSINPKFIRLVGFNLMEKDLIPENIMKYCATVSVASDGNQSNLIFERNQRGVLSNITRNKILEYRILIATQNCFGSMLQMKFSTKFSHVFIDEAGQSVEPETLIPLTLLDPIEGQCVLGGDPNQLGPMLNSRYGKIFKYDSSLLERILAHPFYEKKYGVNCDEYDEKFVTKLNINYRALPSLLKVYNDLFYNGELKSGVDERLSVEASMMSNADSFLWKHTNKKCSVFFVNVNNGKNRKIQDSCSWYNEEEIRAIMSFLHKCSSNQVPFKEIGIVTPYALQVKKLKHQIAVGTSETDLKIGTVEEFQGQERLIILVSTVRTEERQLNFDQRFSLGFLQCPKRMNVAISRAKALLVVFGKEAILKKDENWNYLIDYAKKNHTYVSDNF